LATVCPPPQPWREIDAHGHFATLRAQCMYHVRMRITTHSLLALTFEKMISTSVAVRFLSSSLRSRHNLASFAPSIVAADDLSAPNAQNDLNTSSITRTTRTLTNTAISRPCHYITSVGHYRFIIALHPTPETRHDPQLRRNVESF